MLRKEASPSTVEAWVEDFPELEFLEENSETVWRACDVVI